MTEIKRFTQSIKKRKEFPEDTLKWMIEKSTSEPIMIDALNVTMDNYKKGLIGKANRWFGYYQRIGEEMMLWTLKDIINKVREEMKDGI